MAATKTLALVLAKQDYRDTSLLVDFFLLVKSYYQMKRLLEHFTMKLFILYLNYTFLKGKLKISIKRQKQEQKQKQILKLKRRLLKTFLTIKRLEKF